MTWTYEWNVDLRHCTTGCHAHELTAGTGASLAFVAPDHEYPTTIEAAVTATSSTGRLVTASRRLEPATVVVTVNTSPPGGIVVDSRGDHQTPYALTMIRNGAQSLTVPATQQFTVGEGAFTSWSTGSTTRTLAIQPTENLSVTANYAVPGVCTTAQRLEAEAATLFRVQVDTGWPPHSGTGVVGYFDVVGDTIQWTVNVPAGGNVPLTWRYATTQNSWARTVEVDGVRVGRVTGGSTGAWNRYADTTPLSVPLTPGTHQITMAYRTGDTQFINVDYLDIGCATGPIPTTTTSTTVPPTTTSTTTTTTVPPTTTSTTTTTTLPPTTTSTTTSTTVPTGTTSSTSTSTSTSTTSTSTTTTTVPTTCTAPTRYEAELAILDRVQIDTGWPPHSGTGVVGYFDVVGDSIVFVVTVPAAGNYPLSWRYATTQNNWARTVEVDGVRVGRVTAGSTTAWNRYADTTPLVVPLAAGTHQITMAYRTGDAQFINVDYLSVGCATGTPPVTTTTAPTTSTPTTSAPATTTTTIRPTTTLPATTTTTTTTATTLPGTCAVRRFEAETATLFRVQVDTGWPPHSGTGVVGYFDAVGDTIQWTVNVPAGGTIPLTWRYATTQNNWGRTIEVDGVRVGRATGSSTGAWNRYADTTPLAVTLTPGTHTITMAWRTGDAQLLNVDYLSVGCPTA